MAIKLKYGIFEDRNFQQAIGKLAQYPFRNQMTAYNIARFCRKFDQEIKTGQDLWLKLLRQFAELDTAGNFKPVEIKDEAGNVVRTDHSRYQIPEAKQEEFRLAKIDFDALEFEIPSHPIRINELKDCGLSAADMMSLEPVLDKKILDFDYSEAESSEASEPASKSA